MEMSPETARTPRSTRWVIVGLLLLVAALSVGWVKTFLGVDPFLGFRQDKKGLGQNISARFEDANIKTYTDGVLTGEADVDKMEVREDRQFIDLYGVHNGVFFGDGDAYKFEAEKATWHANQKVLQVLGKSHVAGEDMDLEVPGFTYEQDRSIINIPGRVKGSFLKGDITAASLRYNLTEKTGQLGAIEWTGPATVAFGQDTVVNQVEQPSTRSWNISCPDGETSVKGDVSISVGGVTATDGELIVKADRVEHNRKTGVLVATGNVRYFGAEANMVCPKATVYRKERRAVFSGGVTMLIKPEDTPLAVVEDVPAFRSYGPDELKVAPPAKRTAEEKKFDEELRQSATARKYPVSLRAGEIEYFYKKGDRHAVITGRAEAHQSLTGGRWRHVWTHRALYDAEKDRLTLISSDGNFDTRVKSSIGDDLVAKQVEVSTKRGNDEMRAKQAKGEMFDDEEDLQKDPKKDGGGTPPPKGTDDIGG
jgi:lipopolysaccharide export system protein LptA